ncbi:MAG: hypothetical protein CMP20_10320 [Rickettsiales bacterium]|nr:hypothetical protein [Rickettsiales bacterium]
MSLVMPEQRFEFDLLPTEIKQLVASFLEPWEWINLGFTSKRNMVDVMGMINVGDLTRPVFDLYFVEERQLARKGRYNHKIYNAYAKAIAMHSAWPAVLLGNILWKSARGLDMDNTIDGIIEHRAWTVFFRFCEEEFFDQYTFSSKTLERIDNYGVFVFILTRYRIKWLRSWREASLCEWASDHELFAILTHPNYEPSQAIERKFGLKRSRDDQRLEYGRSRRPKYARKRQKHLACPDGLLTT